ncbi:MAG TPA: PKD domain-containing protein [Rudaea sp.]|jgi:subtilase family serine protease|nr:PKD domain-containing protein [Rudaea sp.]
MAKTRKIFRRTSLTLATSFVFATGAFAAGAQFAHVGSAANIHPDDLIVGTTAANQAMHIEVALKMRNADVLNNFIAAMHAQPGKIAPMDSDRFLSDHAPSMARAQAVANFLSNAGFHNVVIAPNRLLISADGNANVAATAFQTSFANVQTKNGAFGYANNADVRIPAEFQNDILSVVGLQNVHGAHPLFQASDPMAVHPLSVTGHNPTEFSSIYGGSGVQTAAGVTVGIVTQGKITQTVTDLNTFTSQNGLATVTTQTVNTNGTSTDTSGIDEWNLDSQDIVGMAGGQVGKIIFYNIPTLSNANLTADFNTVVSANAVKVLNVSLGECETDAKSDGSAASQDQIFSTADAQGQTISVSTGDSGADECGTGGTTPSWPAASQYVIAVAGTTLNASTTTWSSETVWVDSGGSQSTFEPKPSWQTLWTGTHRGVADVAFDGDPNSGAKIIVNGSSTQVGGTSLSSPLFVGTWARMIAIKGTAVGFAGPLIYQLPAADFHDITSGNNGGSTAAAGYDLASGRGSMIISKVATDLGGGGGGTNQPPVANFSFVANGLAVQFTDASTDSDGTIASRSWTFGDGSTSTATSPSHTYAAAGTYSVSLKVTDNGGATNTKTQSVTVTSSGGGGGSTQLLANTSFETTGSWTSSSGVICNAGCSGESAHTGVGFAWLDGYGSTHTDTLSQAVTITAGKSSATLQYYLHIDTNETTKSTAYDTLSVQVLNSSGTVLATLATYSNLNAASGYTVHTSSLAAYIGQKVTIKFTGKEDSSEQTSFVLDDVTLTVQ